MWSIEVTGITSATRQTIWAWYEATDQAPNWDPLIKRIDSSGPIREGVTGRNYPSTGPSLPFIYTEVTPLVSYTEVSKLPGARAAFTHRLAELPDGKIEVLHGAEISGPLASLYRPLMHRTLSNGMRIAMDNFVRNVQAGPPTSSPQPTQPEG